MVFWWKYMKKSQIHTAIQIAGEGSILTAFQKSVDLTRGSFQRSTARWTLQFYQFIFSTVTSCILNRDHLSTHDISPWIQLHRPPNLWHIYYIVSKKTAFVNITTGFIRKVFGYWEAVPACHGGWKLKCYHWQQTFSCFLWSDKHFLSHKINATHSSVDNHRYQLFAQVINGVPWEKQPLGPQPTQDNHKDVLHASCHSEILKYWKAGWVLWITM